MIPDPIKMSRRNFFLPLQLVARLAKRARRTGTSMSEHVRAALEQYLKDE